MGFFDFLKPVEKKVSRTAHRVGKNVNDDARQVFSFLNNVTEHNQGAHTAVQAVEKGVPAARDIAVATARSIPRAGATIGKSISDVTNRAAGLPKVDAYQPKNNGLAEAILGKEPIKSTQERIKGSEEKGIPTPIAALGTFGMVGLDASGFGGGKKNAAEKVLKELSKAKTAEDVTKVANKLPDAIKERVLANKGSIANATDKGVITKLIKGEKSDIVRQPEPVVPKPEKPVEVSAPEKPEPQVNPEIAQLENQISHTKELKQHAANDTAKAKLDSKARGLIAKKEKLVAEDLKINNPNNVPLESNKPLSGAAQQAHESKATPAGEADTNKLLNEFSKLRKQHGNDEDFYDKVILNNVETKGPIGDLSRSIARNVEGGGAKVTEELDHQLTPINQARDLAEGKSAKLDDLKRTARQLERDSGQKGLYKKLSKNMQGMNEDEQIAYLGKGLTEARDNGAMAVAHLNKQAGDTAKGADKSVLQIIGKDGSQEYKTIKPSEHEAVVKAVDGSEKGIAGKSIDGKTYHITASDPKKMEAAGFTHAGEAGVADIPKPKNIVDATIPKTEGPAKSPDPVNSIIEALRGKPAAKGQSPMKGVNALIGENKANLAQARREKYAAAQEAGKGKSGAERTHAELGALKGEVPKVDASNLQEHLQKTVHPDDVTATIDHIQKSDAIDGYEKIRAKAAFERLFTEGKVPQPNEWKSINKALGSKDLEETVSSASKLYGRATAAVRKVAGTPKAILSSFDLSGMGRQGMFLGTRYPKEWAKSFGQQAKYFSSDKNYEAAMKARSESPNADYYDQMKLALTGVKDFNRGEEAFPTSLAETQAAEKLLVGKGVNASNRGYTGALTEFRGNVADRIIQDLKDSGAIEKMGKKEWESLGRYINTATGRGTLKYTESAAQVLGDFLFSPRLWKSRLDTLNPKYYYDLKGPARKLALQNAGSLAGVVTAVLGLATLAGGKVETDARSSDFLKIKFGDTRVDMLGGLQQNLVFAWREISGEKKSSTTGAITKLGDGYGAPTRLSILADLISNKEAPIPAEASRLLEGHDKAGQPLTIKGEIANSFIPLSPQETISEIKHYGVAKGIAGSIPGYLGAGQQTYGTKDIGISPKQKEYISKISDPKRREAYTNFIQTAKVAAGTKKETSAAIKAALAKGDEAKATKLAVKYNKNYGEGFKKWSKEYSRYRNDEELIKFYNKGAISQEAYDRWLSDAQGGN